MDRGWARAANGTRMCIVWGTTVWISSGDACPISLQQTQGKEVRLERVVSSVWISDRRVQDLLLLCAAHMRNYAELARQTPYIQTNKFLYPTSPLAMRRRITIISTRSRCPILYCPNLMG